MPKKPKAAPDPSEPLENPRHERFAQNRFRGMTQEDAYVGAGFWSNNEGTRRGQASRLDANPIIAARIKELGSQTAAKVVEDVYITAKEVLTELKRIGLSDIALAFDQAGQLKPLDQIPEEARRAIASVEVDELFEGSGVGRTKIGYTKKVKLWDKVKSLDLLGKYLKLWTEKHEHSGRVTLEELVAGSEEKK